MIGQATRANRAWGGTMLTKGDDFPLHQTAEPVAYAGTDRNFYDRYFFNAYPAAAGDDRMIAVAFGVYPQLNIADAHVSWLSEGRQVSVHASCWMNMERLALQVGPIAIDVVEPLQRLRVRIDAPEQGMRGELLFEGRSFPIEEPRFTRRIGPRTFLDYTRLTQNGRYTGWIELDGVRHDLGGFVGTRDRSWGVRPIGARDPQEPAPAAAPQFFWLWSPCVFPDGDFFFHTNDDAQGEAWNRRAVWLPSGSGAGAEVHLPAPRAEIAWRSGTRHADAAALLLDTGDHIAFTPDVNFAMLGIGYGHPQWAHGMNQGALKVAREDIELAALDPALPYHFHIQALSRVRWFGPDGSLRREGRGVLEQLALGAHAPSGFAGLMDTAA
jgi:hypothetical protein